MFRWLVYIQASEKYIRSVTFRKTGSCFTKTNNSYCIKPYMDASPKHAYKFRFLFLFINVAFTTMLKGFQFCTRSTSVECQLSFLLTHGNQVHNMEQSIIFLSLTSINYDELLSIIMYLPSNHTSKVSSIDKNSMSSQSLKNRNRA